MRVYNFTRWETAGLRKIFAVCMAELRRREGKTIKPSSRWAIRVVDHRTYWVGGHAHYHSTGLTLKLPIPDGQRFRSIRGHSIKRWPPSESERLYLEPDLNFSREVADVFFHEVGHCMGVRHVTARRESLSSDYVCSLGVTIELSFRQWIQEAITEDFILKEARASVPKKDVIGERHARAMANLKRAETRLKRAATLLKKWRKKVRYYQAAIAAKEEK